MGVKDLWSILQPAAEKLPLAQMAVQAFEANTSRYRGYTVGIDISIWIGHMKVFNKIPQCGPTAGIQMLLFRCAHLLELPLLPLFVFDGNERPTDKRGKEQQYKERGIEFDAKKVLDAYGFAWAQARGEAEAELAYLNALGVIDAVWTDDGDAFLFGAMTIIRNPSAKLSSNIHANVFTSGKHDANRVQVFKIADLLNNDEIQLNRAGLILIALLRGGDYHKGIDGVGMTIAHGLARCGFGDSLAAVMQSQRSQDVDSFTSSVLEWRAGVVHELRTNSSGQLGTRHPKLAADFPQDFPDIDIYNAYANPVVTSAGEIEIDWYRMPDITKLAETCEHYFSWGSQTEILERFRSIVWPGAVCRALRQHTLEEDGMGDHLQPGLPQLGNLVAQIHRERRHYSTGGLRELRVEIAPAQLAAAARRGTHYLRIPSANYTHGKVHIPPDEPLQIWLPAALVRAALPELVRAFDKAKAREQPRTGKKRAARQSTSDSSASDHETAPRKAARREASPSPSRRPRPTDQSSAASSLSRHVKSTIIILSGSEDDQPNLAVRARPVASAARRQDDADVIVISSSDE
ncbi:PIN domain-like protein [Auricularia subglabra TFB-10046 SS5]|uniref:PIN domain-like protein n=1 Tax=Auricularia subglabra (strain TFB-10046 / SS5) TaxID=717982 RepID=J0D4R5_AURST|nr:PIN domain-like protein [Auricularia subglabra TFB-10046 SS5]